MLSSLCAGSSIFLVDVHHFCLENSPFAAAPFRQIGNCKFKFILDCKHVEVDVRLMDRKLKLLTQTESTNCYFPKSHTKARDQIEIEIQCSIHNFQFV